MFGDLREKERVLGEEGRTKMKKKKRRHPGCKN